MIQLMSRTEQDKEYIFSGYEKFKHLRNLETDWNRIYDANPNLSAFQSFDFNLAVRSVSRFSPRRVALSPRFYVFYGLSGEVRMIAPLFVGRGRESRTVSLFTDHLPAGCADLIYPADLTQQEFDTALSLISRELNDPFFVFNKVNQNSQMNGFLRQGEAHIHKSSKSICMEIPVEESYSTYWEGLRKSARENIRNAHNRLTSDGCTCELKLLQGDRLSSGTIRKIMDIYIKRRSEFEYEGLRGILLGFAKRHLNPVTKALKSSNNTFCAILELDSIPAAFTAGFERPGGRIVLTFLAIDSDWGRYSPGGILITEIMKQLHAQKSHISLDLTRDNEAYKYRYGGKEYYNFDYEFRIRK